MLPFNYSDIKINRARKMSTMDLSGIKAFKNDNTNNISAYVLIVGISMDDTIVRSIDRDSDTTEL